MIRKEELSLTTEWDKTFPKSEKVDHSKVTFVNRYGITLAADMYVASESKSHLYAWRGKPSLISSKIRNKPIFST